MATREVRLLVPSDERALEELLARHADTSMFLRSNLRAAGLVDRGEPLQGTYVGAFDRARLVAVAAHCWNGMVLVQAPEALGEVVRGAVARSGRAVRGVAGPWAQAVEACATLDVDLRSASKASAEDLFALDLDALVLPEPRGGSCRRATFDDLDRLAVLRHDYCVEALGSAPGNALLEAARDDMERVVRERRGWVLTVHGEIAAFSAFNAELPDVVQIGGVFTPPSLRGRGYARAVVAGSLVDARREGVSRAILFTDRDNVAARRAYVSLGFEPIGEYGLVLV